MSTVRILTVALDDGYDHDGQRGVHGAVREWAKARGLRVLWTQTRAGCTDCQGHGYTLEALNGCMVTSHTCQSCGGSGRPTTALAVQPWP
jgi:hypothetical protein